MYDQEGTKLNTRSEGICSSGGTSPCILNYYISKSSQRLFRWWLPSGFLNCAAFVPTLQRKILPPISGWLNLFRWMLQLLASDGGKWSATHPGRFSPQERADGTHWQNRPVKQAKKKSWHYWEINPVIQPHNTDTVLTVILVADKEETSKVLVQSTL